jgi:hypothetical protein
MNIIDGRLPSEHKYGQGFRWYNTEDNISRWSENLNLVPKPYIFSENFKNKYGKNI